MAVHCKCPSCEKTIGLPSGAEGKNVRCPFCKQLFKAPEVEGRPVDSLPTATPTLSPPAVPSLPVPDSSRQAARENPISPTPVSPTARPIAGSWYRHLPAFLPLFVPALVLIPSSLSANQRWILAGVGFAFAIGLAVVLYTLGRRTARRLVRWWAGGIFVNSLRQQGNVTDA